MMGELSLYQETVGVGVPSPRHPRVTPDPTPTRHTRPPPTATGVWEGVGFGTAVRRGD